MKFGTDIQVKICTCKWPSDGTQDAVFGIFFKGFFYLPKLGPKRKTKHNWTQNTAKWTTTETGDLSDPRKHKSYFPKWQTGGEHISWQAKSIKQRKGAQNNTRQTVNIKFDKNKQNNSKLNLQMGSHPTPPFAVAGVFVWSRAQVLAFNNAHCIIDIF